MNLQTLLGFLGFTLFSFHLLLGRAEGGGDSSSSLRTSPPLRIITSILPLQAHTLAVVGDAAVVDQLVGENAGPHNFQLSPSHVRRLAQADLLIVNGGGLEGWMEDLVKRAGNKKLRVVDTSAGMSKSAGPPAMELEGVEVDSSTGQYIHHGHAHGPGESCGADGVNPHFWLDPVLAQQQVKAILTALQEADPSRADVYGRNADVYLEQLEKLDQEFRETLLPLSNKNLVTFHASFPYLAARYGLNYVGYIEAFPERDPTPQQLAALVEAIRENEVGVLFAEKGYSAELLQRVAELSGARVSELDTLELGQATAESYLQRMRDNLRVLREALAQPAAP